MKTLRLLAATLATTMLLYTGCGGGGSGGIVSVSGPGGGGIGGTGYSSSGTIDGFGSIFVNGVEIETDTAQVTLNGNTAAAEDLKLGMVVTVKGTINADAVTGVAASVVFDSEVEGPVQAVQEATDGDTRLLTILGLEVIVERVGTVFDGVSFASLAVGDVLEVSGFRTEGQRLRATRVEKKSTFVPGESEIEIEGTVANLAAVDFTLGQYTVDYRNADLSAMPGGVLQNGQIVEVRGSLEGLVITAQRISLEDGLSNSLVVNETASLQGTITGYLSRGQFQVNGIPVDASSARLEPADLVLGNGLIVEAKGVWTGTVLEAREIKVRRGRIEIEAGVTAVDTTARTITLGLFAGSVTLSVDTRTLLKDDTGQAQVLTLAAIRAGDFLEVEALRSGETLLATRIERDERDDDVLQAPVDSFTAGSDITLLGVNYRTLGAEFEDADSRELAAAEFYTLLQVGDLVKVKDEHVADGVADEVEFERSGGDDDFEPSCEFRADEQDDDCESEDEEDEDEDEEEEDEEDDEEDEEDEAEDEDEEDDD